MRAVCATLALAACAPDAPVAFGLVLHELGSDPDFPRFEAEQGPVSLALALQPDLPQGHAARLAEERSRRFRSAWEPNRTGYPGQISETVECPPELLPTAIRRSISDGTLQAWQTWATPAGTAGACAQDLVAAALVRAWIACDRGLLAELDLRGPREAPERLTAILERARCDELLALTVEPP